MRFRRVARLGRGGMGVVDLAQTDSGEQVALKRITLAGSAAELARARQRISREAEVLTRLDHPNIVGLLGVLEEGDEITLVMPYLPGGTLADRVGRHGPAPAEAVTELADALGGALAAAHRMGVVHRDLKPGNVLFDAEGVAHIVDFGVASSREHTAGLTAVGTVVGTPGFMAPEQARGEPTGPAADVFSLGATLLYAATGQGPYGRGAPELLMVRAARGQVEPVPRGLPPELRRRLQAMLDPRPDRRPSAGALAGGVDGTMVHRAVARRRRRWPLWLAASGVGVVALAAGVAVASRETGPGPTTTTSSTTEPCRDLPYQPCGQTGPAPNTDGRACRAGFDDYDGLAANGCEAEPDGLEDGVPLEPTPGAISATIVPRDDVDTFTLDVPDRFQLLCDGRFTLTLTAPEGMSLRLELLDGDDEVVGEATSADGVPAAVVVRESDCFFDDEGRFTARVSPIGSDRTAEPYTLERQGNL